MKYLLLAALCLPLVCAASENPAPATPDSVRPGTPFYDASPFAALPYWIQINAQLRGRFEAPTGTSLINRVKQDYYLDRLRVGLGLRPFPWLRFYAEAQDARVAGYSVSPAPNTLANPFDLRQGYGELNFEGATTMRFRAGRQELLFGGERLIGPADWGMSRTFDAVDLSVSRERGRVDFFAGSPVLVDPTRFDRHKPGEHLYGAYGAVKKLLPGLNVEPYLLFKQVLNVKSELGSVGDALVVSPGLRVTGMTRGRIDYAAEVVMQRGSYSADRISAYAESYVAGWTLSAAAWKPRVSVEYNYASGDGNSKDGAHDTFDQFYPSNHAYYGMIDQFGWRNLKNARAGFNFQGTRKLSIRLDANQFYLATVQDGLYNSSGSSLVCNRKASSDHIGAEVNGVALYQLSKIWKFGAGYGRLFAGGYLKQANYGFSYNYPYLMFVGAF